MYSRILILASALLPASPLAAHMVARGVGTAAMVSIEKGKISIEFDLSFSSTWGHPEMVKMDTDRDGTVSSEEARAFMMSAWKEKLAPHLKLSVDGTDLPLELLTTREVDLVGEIGPVPFETFYKLEAVLPGMANPGGEHLLEMLNNTLQKESPFPPAFYMPLSPPSPEIVFNIIEPPQLLDMLGPTEAYVMTGRKLVVKFRMEGSTMAATETATVATTEADRKVAKKTAPGPSLRPEDRKDPFLGEVSQAFKEYQDLGLWGMIVLVLIAMVYGAAHAFQPGHGKTVVAAYLVGSGGKITDAILLGLATTFSHTIVVFLAGLGLQIAIAYGTSASPAAIQNRIVVGTSLLSGFLLFLMGLVLFLRRVRFAGNFHAMEHYYHHHHHDHHHDHHESEGHEHGHGSQKKSRGGRPSFWTLIGLGASGGIVPCPAGIMIILIGLFYQKLLFALLLLLFFSLALGSVLVALGIFFVTGRKFFEGRVSSRFLTYLPSFSALVIAGLGVLFMVQTFRMGRTEIAGILESLAGIIRGS